MVVSSGQPILEAELIYCLPGSESGQEQAIVGSLTSATFSWSHRGYGKRLQLKDIVSISPLKKGFVVSACPFTRRHRWSKAKHRQLERYEFHCSKELQPQWINAFATALGPVKQHLTVILNASSGRGQGAQVFKQVRSLFQASHIALAILEPEDGRQTQKWMRSLDLDNTDGLVIVGGDGTVHDVINGLMQRSDVASAIKTPIGVIPAGTGNGLCQSLLAESGEPFDAMSAAFMIAKGQPQPLDILQIQQGGQQSYGFLSLAWGLVSDIDLGSEFLRWLGPLRSDLYALWLIARLRSHPGRLVFESGGYQQTLEGNFITIWGMNVPWATHKDLAAPQAQRADGELDLIIVRQSISRWRLLQAFLHLDTGEHVQLPEVEYFKVQHLLLAPTGTCGTLAVDGEAVAHANIEVTVRPRLARTFTLPRLAA